MSREITPTQIAKAISDLLEENEKLKERIEYLERSNDRREESIIYLREESIDFETRIDKAIELIKQYDNTFIEMNLAIKLREILKGENNER